MRYLSFGLKTELNFLVERLRGAMVTKTGFRLEMDPEHNLDFMSIHMTIKTQNDSANIGYVMLEYSNETGFFLKFQNNLSMGIKMTLDQIFEDLLYQYSRTRYSDRFTEESVLMIPT